MRRHDPRGVRGRQIGKNPEYDLDFLLELTSAILNRMPEASALRLNRFEFRMKPWVTHHNADGQHEWNPTSRESTIFIRSSRNAEHMAPAIAHELVHAVQFQSGSLRHAEGGWVWKGGKPFQGTTPYHQRPWETEAAEMEVYGDEVYANMRKRGLVPLSRSEKITENLKAQGWLPRNPITMGELEGLPDDLAIQIIRDLKAGRMTEEKAREVIALSRSGVSAGRSRSRCKKAGK